MFEAGYLLPGEQSFFWRDDVLWTHVVSDALTGLACLVISYHLWRIFRDREVLNPGWLLALPGLFFFGSGATHLMEVLNVWNPFYRFEGLVKAITALASVGLAVALLRKALPVRIVPAKKPRQEGHDELLALNEELTAANEELAATNEELSAANLLIDRQATQLVRQSEEKLNRILSTIPDVVWSVSRDFKDLYFISPGSERLFGYPADKFYQTPGFFMRLVYEEDRAGVKEILAGLAVNPYAEAEYRIRHGDSKICWLSSRLWLVAGADGEPGRIDGITSDVTRGKEADTELHKRERILSSLLQSQTNFLIRTDLQGRYTFVNRSFLEKYGYGEDIIGQVYFSTVHPDDTDNCQVMAGMCIANPGQVFSLEMRKPGKNGEIFDTEWEFIAIQDERGAVVELQGVGQDVTERKRSEAQVTAYAKRMHSLLESLTDAFFALDRNWAFTVVNREFERLLRRTREELLGRNVWEAFPEATELQFYPQYHRAVAENIPVHFEEYFPPLDDWYEVNAYPSEEGLAVNFRRINERKKAEMERNRLIQELSRQNQDLQQFGMITSHNLRAPIANMLGLVSIYNRDEPADPVNATIIDSIGESARKFDEVIRDLNYLLSLRSHLEEKREWITLEESFKSITGSIAGQIESSGARISTDFGAAPLVYSVRRYVQNILLNLLSNAIKYRAPDRTPSIRIETHAEDEFVCLTVADNGLGINLTKYKDRVFGLYQRFHLHKEGRGLGLHLVKTQAEALGGKVSVESAEGQGTTFRVYLKQSDAGEHK